MRKITALFVLLFCWETANAANHDFTGLPLDANGWTDLAALVQSNSRIVYVSTSGNDGTAQNYDSTSFPDPFKPSGEAAYHTIAAAEAQMRDGYPDIMLLKRGDTWTENIIDWDKDGESATTPMIVAAYGSTATARPIMEKFDLDNSLVQYLVIADIEFAPTTSIYAFQGAGPLNYVTIEGCLIGPGPLKGLVLQDETTSQEGTLHYLALRRNVICGRYSPAGTTGDYVHGLYIDDARELLIEENIIDDNGKDELDADQSNDDTHSHNTYVMLLYDAPSSATMHIGGTWGGRFNDGNHYSWGEGRGR